MANEILTPSQSDQAPVAERAVRAWYAPLVDILEYADRFEVIADLPGVSMDDVDLTLHDDRLSIEARRGDIGFRRAFSVPSDVDAEGVDARLEHGVLTVTLPRAEPAGPKKITIRS